VEILKVKDWIEVRKSGAQFKIIHESMGEIYVVRRLSDGKFFTKGTYVKEKTSSITIVGFLRDLIHIQFSIQHQGRSEARVYTEQIEGLIKWGDFRLGTKLSNSK
jgi:hypothetical protein